MKIIWCTKRRYNCAQLGNIVIKTSTMIVCTGGINKIDRLKIANKTLDILQNFFNTNEMHRHRQFVSPEEIN